MPRRPRVLVVDDGEAYARLLAAHPDEFRLAGGAGGDPAPCLPDGPSALAFLARHASDVDVVLLDIQFDVSEERLLPLEPGAPIRRTKRFQGVAIFREIRRRHPEIPIVLLTAAPDLSLVDAGGELASESLTYFLDQDDLDTLRIRIHTAVFDAALESESGDLFWGNGREMRALRQRLAVLSRGTLPILLEGETGTGKSHLAGRFIHPGSGRPGPFVTLDLATIPGDLVASRLFGALRGSFTGAVVDRPGVFELAHRGTLFLDEIQNAPPDVQKQLLVVLQEKRIRPLGGSRETKVDVKVVVASNESLEEAVVLGRFRQDLYMRLGPATRVVIPPLRSRKSDLLPFARRLAIRSSEDPDNQRMLREVAPAVGLPEGAGLELAIGRKEERNNSRAAALVLVLPETAWRRIEEHSWPGNIRELEMVVHNLVTFTLVAASGALRQGVRFRSPRLQVDPGLVGGMIDSSRVMAVPGGSSKDSAGARLVPVRVVPQKSLSAVATEVERQYLRELFERSGGDFEVMAEMLLGDRARGRAVRLRLNQVGLKVREMKRH